MGGTDRKGKNPFLELGCSEVPTYDWVVMMDMNTSRSG